MLNNGLKVQVSDTTVDDISKGAQAQKINEFLIAKEEI